MQMQQIFPCLFVCSLHMWFLGGGQRPAMDTVPLSTLFDRVSCSFLRAPGRLPGPQASRVCLVSTSHLSVGVLGSQTHAADSGFVWVLGAQVFTLTRAALTPGSPALILKPIVQNAEIRTLGQTFTWRASRFPVRLQATWAS